MCHVLLAVKCVHGWRSERSENGDEDEEREMIGGLVEVCKRRGLTLNTNKSVWIVLGSGEGTVNEVSVVELIEAFRVLVG